MKIIMIIIIIVAMTLKALKVSIFYYYLTYHGNEWACSKEKKRVFYFLTKIKIKAANQCFLIAENVLVIKKLNYNNNKQTKKNQEKNKQIKNGNNSTHHKPLFQEWIGRRS